MSWVSGVILIVELGEYYDDETDKPICEVPDDLPAVKEINQWLDERLNEKLTCLSSLMKSGKVMPAEVFAGAFNYLNVNAFDDFVRSRKWKRPENIQLLIKDQEEERFILTDMSDG